MPIAVRCQCGKTLNVRDELVGKAVKCPACQQVVRVPGGPAATASPATRPAPRTAAAAAAPSAMDNLFNQAGFEVKVGQFCPQCSSLLQPGAVLCTTCGFHLEAGTAVLGHKVELEEEGAEAILSKAKRDMQRSVELQERLKGAGMPWWILGLILFGMVSITGVAVTAVNLSRRKEADFSFNATATLLLLAGAAAAAVCLGANLVVVARAFKENKREGFLVLLAPLYIIYYAISRFKRVGAAYIVAVVAGVAAGACFVLAGMSNNGQL